MNTEKYTKHFKVHLQCANFSQRTIATYTSLLRRFLNAGWSEETPKQINTQRLKQYICLQSSTSTMRQVHGMLNHFYTCIGQPRKMKHVPYPKKEKRLPTILPAEVLNKRIKRITNLKHQCICSVLYGCGLRVSELTNLKLADIDGVRCTIKVRAGKGKKDRLLPLPAHLLQKLRTYYKQYRPKVYLFEGNAGARYTSTSVQKITKKHLRTNPHNLRHSFATHAHEAGTPLAVLQQLLGHSNIKTTMVYLQISQRQMLSAVSPLAA